METLSATVDRLNAAGYTDDFRAEPEGLRAVGTGCIHPPEALIIDEIVRFEGATDPDDEAIVLALRCPVHGGRGTYIVAYGVTMPAIDAEMVQRLQAKE
jgi:hypothetical protein